MLYIAAHFEIVHKNQKPYGGDRMNALSLSQQEIHWETCPACGLLFETEAPIETKK